MSPEVAAALARATGQPESRVETSERELSPEVAAALRRASGQPEELVETSPMGEDTRGGWERFKEGFSGGVGDVVYGAGNMVGAMDDESLAAHKKKYARSNDAGFFSAGGFGDLLGESFAMAPLGLLGKGAQAANWALRAKKAQKMNKAREGLARSRKYQKKAAEHAAAAKKKQEALDKFKSKPIHNQTPDARIRKGSIERDRAKDIADDLNQSRNFDALKKAADTENRGLVKAARKGKDPIRAAESLRHSPRVGGVKLPSASNVGRVAENALAGAITADPGERLQGAGIGAGLGGVGDFAIGRAKFGGRMVEVGKSELDRRLGGRLAKATSRPYSSHAENKFIRKATERAINSLPSGFGAPGPKTNRALMEVTDALRRGGVSQTTQNVQENR